MKFLLSYVGVSALLVNVCERFLMETFFKAVCVGVSFIFLGIRKPMMQGFSTEQIIFSQTFIADDDLDSMTMP